MKNILFVVDGNWYLHRCFFTLKTNSPNYGEKLALMFLGLVCKDALAVKATHLLVGFDGPKVFRYSVYPQYKATRKSHEEDENVATTPINPSGISSSDIYQYLPDIFSLLSELCITFVQPEIYEADDIGCSASYKYSSPDCKVVVGTKDKDSYQFLSDTTCLYDSSYKKNGKPAPRYITVELAEKLKGVSVSNMIAYQCLLGDAIDNVPSVLPPAKAKKLLNTFGSIKGALQNGDDDLRIFLNKNMAKILLNQKLVTLCKTVSLPELSCLKVSRKDIDTELRGKLPKSYFSYVDLVNPRTRSLF